MRPSLSLMSFDSLERLEVKLSPTTTSVVGVLNTTVVLPSAQSDDDDPPPEPEPPLPPYPGDNPPLTLL